jgi:hypothetical protein
VAWVEAISSDVLNQVLKVNEKPVTKVWKGEWCLDEEYRAVGARGEALYTPTALTLRPSQRNP